MKTNTIEQIKVANPVRQNFHTGRWGFQRVHDCVDLNRCIYATERAAQIARHRWAKQVIAIETIYKATD